MVIMATKNFKSQKTKLGSENKWIKTSYLNLSTNFKFSGRNSQSQQKLVKKPHSFYKPNLTQHCKTYTPATQPKTWCWLVSEKALALTISKTAFLEHLKSKCLHIPINRRSNISVPERGRKLFSGGADEFPRFEKRKIFHFNWNSLLEFNYYLAFRYFHQ